MAEEIKETEDLNVDLEEGTGDEEVFGEVEESTEPAEEPATEEPPAEEAQEEEEVSEEPQVEPTQVERETPAEIAQRKEIERLRDKLRDKETGELFKAPKVEQKPSEAREKLRERYSDEEIENLNLAIDVLATEKGYVNKSQYELAKANDSLKEFLSTRKEYSKEVDKDDSRWNVFLNIIGSDYRLEGKTPKELERIYEKVDRDVQEYLGEVEYVDEEETPKPKREEIAAKQQKIRSVSHSGGTKAAPQRPAIQVDPSTRELFRDFEDEDFVPD